jgi:hypothetical protein
MAMKFGLRRKNDSRIEAVGINTSRSVKSCAVSNEIKSYYIIIPQE